jgi:hypothetical protein
MVCASSMCGRVNMGSLSVCWAVTAVSTDRCRFLDMQRKRVIILTAPLRSSDCGLGEDKDVAELFAACDRCDAPPTQATSASHTTQAELQVQLHVRPEAFKRMHGACSCNRP